MAERTLHNTGASTTSLASKPLEFGASQPHGWRGPRLSDLRCQHQWPLPTMHEGHATYREVGGWVGSNTATVTGYNDCLFLPK